MRFWIFALFLWSTYSTTHSNQLIEEMCNAYLPPISKVINHLSHSLTTEIGGNENVFFSPLSISIALGMLYLGARGRTAEEMKSALLYNVLQRGNSSQEDVHRHFRSLLTSLGHRADEEEYTLLAANGLFTQMGYDILPQFTSGLERYYAAKFESVDFSHDGNTAVNKINEFVSNNTRGVIPKLFSQPLDTMTLMVLINAIYFKGLWEIPFNEHSTYEQIFYGVNGVESRVPFMEFKEVVGYFYDDESQYRFVELNYKGNDTSMLLALPEAQDTFPELRLTSQKLCKIRAHLRKTNVHVRIPKFKMEFERELSRDLQRLGMAELFSQDPQTPSNLTGVQENNDLYVSQVLHKAIIEVNEQGSEAAAVTSIVFYSRKGNSMQNIFFANHPFLFIILDKRSGSSLFMGRVSSL